MRATKTTDIPSNGYMTALAIHALDIGSTKFGITPGGGAAAGRKLDASRGAVYVGPSMMLATVRGTRVE